MLGCCRKRREFGPNRVLQEAAWICSHPTINDISVVDPIFNAGRHYMQVHTPLRGPLTATTIITVTVTVSTVTSYLYSYSYS